MFGPIATDGGASSAIQLALVLTLISLAPAIVLSCTTFARFVVVFSFLRTGLGTAGAPPSQVLVGLALFMSLFVMAPTATELHRVAVAPYMEGSLDEEAALDAAAPVLKAFLLPHTRQDDLALFYEVSQRPRPGSPSDVSLDIAIPAFMLSELKTAFEMGFIVLLPFLVVDLIVASVLSALGMVMLPPAVVSLPIKILVFVAADGWNLVVGSLLRGVMG
jgi:flagellar biosynthetic protein FliP